MIETTTEKPKHNFEQLRARAAIATEGELMARCYGRGFTRNEIECLKRWLFDRGWLELLA